MPQIPQLGQTTRMEYTSPVQIASVEQAGQQGEGVYRLGKAVSEFGQDLADVHNRKNAAKRNLDAATDHQDAATIGIQINSEILADETISPNDYANTFVERYEKAIDPIRKRRQGGDPLVEQASSNEIAEVKNKFFSDLSQLGRVESSAQMVNQVKNISSKGSAIAFQDPSQIDSQIVLFDKTIQELSKTQFYDAKTALKVRGDGPAEIIEGGIAGLMAKDRYDDANGLLLKYSQYLDVSRQKAISREIKSAQLNFTDRQNREEDRQEKETKRLLTKTQSKNFTYLGSLLLKAKTKEEKESIFKQARAMVVTKQIEADGDGSYQTLINLDKDIRGEKDKSKFYYFTEKLTGGYDTDKLRKEVMSDVSSNKMGHEDGIKALNAIEAYERRQQSDPSYRESWKAAEDKLSAKFGKDTLIETMTAEKRFAKGQARDSIISILDKNPNILPSKAADIVLKKQFGSIPVLVPGLQVYEQQSAKDIDSGISRLQEKYKSGQITKKQYLESLKKAKEQKTYLLNTETK